MEDIIHVRPYDKREEPVFSGLITSSKYTEPIEVESVTIPVPKGLNIDQILMDNNDKMNQEEEDIEMEVDEEVKYYLNLKDMDIQNLKDQVSLIIFKGFKNLTDQQIEKIFNELLHSYKWGKLETDTITVFLRAGSLVDLKTVCESVEIFDNLCEQVIINVHGIDMSEITAREISKHKVSGVVNSAIRASRKIRDSRKQNLPFYESSYKIDANELIDVPNSIKQTIIQELIKFRSSMLTKEQEKRNKELIEERSKSKQILKSLFTKDSSVAVEKEDVMVLEPEEDRPELNDEEYEAYLTRVEEDEFQREYEVKLREMEVKKSTYEKLQNMIDTLNNYENDLIENKFKYIDDIKDYQYKSYSDYWTKRSKIKQREEELDEIDRRGDGDTEGGNSPKGVSDTEKRSDTEKIRNTETSNPEDNLEMAAKKVVSASDEKGKGQTSPEDQTPQEIQTEETKTGQTAASVAIPSISDLNATQLKDLKLHISSLVETYIGIQEDELVEFIFDGLKTQTLTLSELTETFDNDAINLIQSIQTFIK